MFSTTSVRSERPSRAAVDEEVLASSAGDVDVDVLLGEEAVVEVDVVGADVDVAAAVVDVVLGLVVELVAAAIVVDVVAGRLVAMSTMEQRLTWLSSGWSTRSWLDQLPTS